jgi:hypothetical protein
MISSSIVMLQNDDEILLDERRRLAQGMEVRNKPRQHRFPGYLFADRPGPPAPEAFTLAPAACAPPRARHPHARARPCMRSPSDHQGHRTPPPLRRSPAPPTAPSRPVRRGRRDDELCRGGRHAGGGAATGAWRGRPRGLGPR